MTQKAIGFGALAALAFSAAMAPAGAHEARPLSIQIAEFAEGRYAVEWRAPPSIGAANAPAVALGAPCLALGRAGPVREAPFAGRALYDCRAGAGGAALSIRYPFYNPSVASLVRIERRSGEVSTALLGPEIFAWEIPAPETLAGVSRSYFELGVKHILIGIDHILFLAGLLLLARTPKRVLVTVTGFTLAHSLTLALVALDAVRVSVPAIEALIALSIVFVAAEIARGDRTTIAWRRPVIVASAFGLLHGAGFAAVLGEIGLPQTERVAALIFFNAGVEAGQIMIVALAFAGLFLLRRAAETFGLHSPRTPGVLPAPPLTLAGYGLGLVSAYWFFERAAALLV